MNPIVKWTAWIARKISNYSLLALTLNLEKKEEREEEKFDSYDFFFLYWFPLFFSSVIRSVCKKKKGSWKKRRKSKKEGLSLRYKRMSIDPTKPVDGPRREKMLQKKHRKKKKKKPKRKRRRKQWRSIVASGNIDWIAGKKVKYVACIYVSNALLFLFFFSSLLINRRGSQLYLLRREDMTVRRTGYYASLLSMMLSLSFLTISTVTISTFKNRQKKHLLVKVGGRSKGG